MGECESDGNELIDILGRIEMLQHIVDDNKYILNVSSIIGLGFEIAHMNSSHISKKINKGDLELCRLAVENDELIHLDPVSILYPFFIL
jgi:hypothetical protein